jgi:hypothetical protein
LPRPEQAGWISILIAISGIMVALIGNIILNPQDLSIFLNYLIPTLMIVGFMLYRIKILKNIFYFINYLTPDKSNLFKGINSKIINKIRKINSQEFVFFTNHDNVVTIKKVLQYITDNEHTKRLKIVAILNEHNQIAPKLKNDIEVLDRAFPLIKVQFIEEPGEFGPEKIKELSKRWDIPINFMFIGSPGDKFPFKLEELGEVRLII